MNQFLFGMFIGVWTVIGLISLPNSDLSMYRKLKQDCEISLPRNQTCKLIAVPSNQEEK